MDAAKGVGAQGVSPLSVQGGGELCQPPGCHEDHGDGAEVPDFAPWRMSELPRNDLARKEGAPRGQASELACLPEGTLG